MSESVATEQPIRVNARTARSVLARSGSTVGSAALLAVATNLGYAWDGWALAIPSIALFAILSGMFAADREWIVDGRRLFSRRWYSFPGREPRLVTELGPDRAFVHETRFRWRIEPFGPAIAVRAGQARTLAVTMAAAGVVVDDWRGNWAIRHRALDAIGRALQYVAAVGMFVAIALGGPTQPAGFALFWGSMAAMSAGFAIDFVPWSRRPRRPSAYYWPALAAPVSDGPTNQGATGGGTTV